MLSRRKWLSLAGLAALPVAAYPVGCEPFWLQLSHTDVHLGPALAHPIRILHLADFHASPAVPMLTINHAVSMGLQQRPDLICLTGDFISNRSGFNEGRYVQTLKRLTAAAPTFAVLGNHDGGCWATLHRGFPDHQLVDRMLSQSGVTLLYNRSTIVRVNNSDLQLVGVGDLWSEEIDAASAFKSINRKLPTVLLSHNPDSKDLLYSHPGA